jgi:hemoglobin
MLHDITSRYDIEVLMNRFYQKALTDEVIGFYFIEVIQLNMQKHLPIIVDFWENILLNAHYYGRDPMQAHQQLHLKHPFEAVYFDRWIALFTDTVSASFVGPKAEIAKQRAYSIGTVMKMKFIYHHE